MSRLLTSRYDLNAWAGVTAHAVVSARELAELAVDGIGIHHAGMLRSDRNLVERLFREGLIKVLRFV